MAEKYHQGSEELASAAEALSRNMPQGPWRIFAEQIHRQAEFESAELESMYFQQSAMCKLAEAQIGNSESAAKEACSYLEKNLQSIENAAEKCRAAGYPDSWLHLDMRIPMERKEAENKLKQFSKFKEL